MQVGAVFFLAIGSSIEGEELCLDRTTLDCADCSSLSPSARFPSAVEGRPTWEGYAASLWMTAGVLFVFAILTVLFLKDPEHALALSPEDADMPVTLPDEADERMALEQRKALAESIVIKV